MVGAARYKLWFHNETLDLKIEGIISGSWEGSLDLFGYDLPSSTEVYYSISKPVSSTSRDKITVHAIGFAAPSSPREALSLKPVTKRIQESSSWKSVKRLRVI